MKKQKIRKSECCGASVFVDGDDKEGTHFFVCGYCGKPCDIEGDER